MDWYRWLLAAHVIGLIAWMAGLLYLPRLFVYHAEAPAGSAQAETFKVMERRLQRAIMNPAMAATWIFGLALIWAGGHWGGGWLYAKLVLVLALTALHGEFARWRKEFERDANTRPARFYRFWNEAPAVLMVGIVILVIIKPF